MIEQAEHFEVFAEDGSSHGLMPRDVVHRTGAWHKACQVFVYNRQGQLLLQQRSADKDLHPHCWDSSVGEHLKPGETFIAGAQRGLQEELGITGVAVEPVGAEVRLSTQTADYYDREIQQAFRCTYEGELRLAADEVAQTCWVDRAQLQQMLNEAQFTPWFLKHQERYGLINSLS